MSGSGQYSLVKRDVLLCATVENVPWDGIDKPSETLSLICTNRSLIVSSMKYIPPVNSPPFILLEKHPNTRIYFKGFMVYVFVCGFFFAFMLPDKYDVSDSQFLTRHQPSPWSFYRFIMWNLIAHSFILLNIEKESRLKITRGMKKRNCTSTNVLLSIVSRRGKDQVIKIFCRHVRQRRWGRWDAWVTLRRSRVGHALRMETYE